MTTSVLYHAYRIKRVYYKPHFPQILQGLVTKFAGNEVTNTACQDIKA